MKQNKKNYKFGQMKKAVNNGRDIFHLNLKGVDTETGLKMIMNYCDALGAKYGHYHVVVDDGKQQMHLVK